MKRLITWALLLVGVCTFITWLSTPGRAATPTPETILADGQFVNGPNVGEFDIAAYLEQVGSPLAPYASVIDDQASYYSINPRLLLTLLELRSGTVTGRQADLDLENLVGYADAPGFVEQLQKLSESLFQTFYARLYGPSPAEDASLRLALLSGEAVDLTAQTNPGSYAVLSALAPLSTPLEWEALESPQHPAGFTQVYLRLFPDSDPLDDSNSLRPEAPPPPDLLKLPFQSGDTWNFSGGPHSYTGDCSTTLNSVDFAPGVPHCTIPPDRWATAAAGGFVKEVSCGACQVEIDHGGGWSTRYYHLANTQVVYGQTVAQDQLLGNPSCKPEEGGSCGSCGGWASGTHVHMGLKYNGAYSSIVGAGLEGWIVNDDDPKVCYDGFLQKGSQVVNWGGSVQSTLNMPDIYPPVSSHNLSATLGENGWYLSNVQLTLSAVDVGNSGLKEIKYWTSDLSWLTYTAPVMISGEGNHPIIYYARDNAGNTERWNIIQAPIDTLAPSGSTWLNGGAIQTTSALVWFNAAGSDATSGVTYIRARNTGGSWYGYPNQEWSTLWPLPGPTNRTLSVEVQFKDQAGNLSPSIFTSIFLDLNPSQPASGNYWLLKDIFSASGAAQASASYLLQGSLGQPSTLGKLSSASYRLTSGFWGTTPALNVYYLPLVFR